MLFLRLLPTTLFAAQSNHIFKDRSLKTALEEYDHLLRTVAYDVGTQANKRTAKILHEIGDLYYDHGDVAEARTKYEQSLEMLMDVFGKEAKNNMIASTCDSLGKLYSSVGRNEEAIQMYEKSLSIKQASFMDVEEETKKTTAAVSGSAIQSYTESLESVEKAVKDQDSKNYDLVDTLKKLVALHEKMGNSDAAKECYKEAMDILKKMVDIPTHIEHLAP